MNKSMCIWEVLEVIIWVVKYCDICVANKMAHTIIKCEKVGLCVSFATLVHTINDFLWHWKRSPAPASNALASFEVKEFVGALDVACRA